MKALNLIYKMPNELLDGFFDVERFWDAEVVFVSTGRYYDKNFIDQFPKIKILASNTTTDQHIDTKYCMERGIKVITLNKSPILEEITAVAELTIGLIIALTRNIIPSVNSVLFGQWSRYFFGGEKMLKNMTLSIIGMGRIGCHVLKRADSLFERVYCYDLLSRHSIESILKQSDVVTVHVTLAGNENMFNENMFSKFKPGSYFINTSRGEIVDENALISVLESRHLAGAATDVLSNEFDGKFNVMNSPLYKYAKNHDNLIITPHIGGSTEDAWEMTQKEIIRKTYEAVNGDVMFDPGTKGQQEYQGQELTDHRRQAVN